jgi:hypothetical protein
MYMSNPRWSELNPKKRRSPFDEWAKFVYLILWKGHVLTSARETLYNEYGIDPPSLRSISHFLEKHPQIKDAYLSKPWVKTRSPMEWVGAQCQEYREVIDYIVPDYPSQEILSHLQSCAGCHLHYIKEQCRAGIPYRIDCFTYKKLRQILEGDAPQCHVCEFTNDPDCSCITTTATASRKAGKRANKHSCLARMATHSECGLCNRELSYIRTISSQHLDKLVREESLHLDKCCWRHVLNIPSDLQIIDSIRADSSGEIELNDDDDILGQGAIDDPTALFSVVNELSLIEIVPTAIYDYFWWRQFRRDALPIDFQMELF